MSILDALLTHSLAIQLRGRRAWELFLTLENPHTRETILFGVFEVL